MTYCKIIKAPYAVIEEEVNVVMRHIENLEHRILTTKLADVRGDCCVILIVSDISRKGPGSVVTREL